MPSTKVVVSVPVGAPDSELTRRATHLVAELSPTFLFNHSARTFLFGDALGKRDSLKYDRELLYLISILHDLGLTETYLGGDQRFEVEGADRARAFVLEHGRPEEKAEIVWDAIALNTSVGIALRKGPEIALPCLGAGADLLGLRLNDLPPAVVEQIVAEYPRPEFLASFTDLFVECIRRKPQVVSGTFLEVVAHSHTSEIHCATWADLLAQGPWKE